jgi:hypothetical protein
MASRKAWSSTFIRTPLDRGHRPPLLSRRRAISSPPNHFWRHTTRARPAPHLARSPPYSVPKSKHLDARPAHRRSATLDYRSLLQRPTDKGAGFGEGDGEDTLDGLRCFYLLCRLDGQWCAEEISGAGGASLMTGSGFGDVGRRRVRVTSCYRWGFRGD